MDKRFKRLRAELEGLTSRRVLRDAGAYLDDRRIELDRLRERLTAGMEAQLGAKRREQVRLAASLDAMSPLRVLRRGYTIATDEGGSIVSSVKTLKTGEKLCLKLSDGSVFCTVDETDEEKIE